MGSQTVLNWQAYIAGIKWLNSQEIEAGNTGTILGGDFNIACRTGL